MKCDFRRWLIWTQIEQKKSIPTQEFDSDQVEIQKGESKLVQKWGPDQIIDAHTLSLSLKCDHKILVIQFHGVLVQDSMLTPE